MNAERLHAIALAVQSDLEESAIVNTLTKLKDSLQNYVNQPQQANFQKQVSEFLGTAKQSLSRSRSNEFSPVWMQTVDEIGGRDLLGERLLRRIEEIFAKNQITPSMALEELTAIHNDLTAFETGVAHLLEGMGQLGIGAEELEPGECEVSILVPREGVDNNLKKFGNEVVELEAMLGVFTELVTGKRPGFSIRTVSSSDLTVLLDIAAPVAAFLAVSVERVLAAYKTILEIRKLRGELKGQDVPDSSLKGLDQYLNGLMAKKIDETVEWAFTNYLKKHKGDGRDNELRIELRMSLNKIANRIDRGYNIEVRAEPMDDDENLEDVEEAEAPDRAYVQTVLETTKALQFLRLDGDPVLQLPESPEEKKKKD